ncbi:MAG: OmpH family outer membrane protein, partial [Thiobacillaceae bacterium]|nr:OmpH family outer membrane protein [Thiobacillaceae bacterium]
MTRRNKSSNSNSATCSDKESTLKRIALLLLCVAFPAMSLAADLKIGFVNTEKLFRESPLAVKAQKKLEKEFQSREQEIQKQVKQARELQNHLEKEGLTMS